MKKGERKVPQQRTELDRIVTQLRTALRHETKNIIEAGELLKKARDLIEHGEWLPWLAENFDLSERTAHRYIVSFMYVDEQREAKSDTVSDFTNLAPSVLYALAAFQYNEQQEAAILAATREGRVDQDKALAICDALAPPDDDADDGEAADDDAAAADSEREIDSEIEAILDGPPQEVPPPAPIAAPPDFALRSFDEAVTALKQLTTKPASQFTGSVHSVGDLENVESFIHAVTKTKMTGK
jgi:Protein of unknown function (DUF3102)